MVWILEFLSGKVFDTVPADYQEKGIGTELVAYLTQLAKKQGLTGFTAEMLVENRFVLHLLEKMGFDVQKRSSEGMYELKVPFRGSEILIKVSGAVMGRKSNI